MVKPYGATAIVALPGLTVTVIALNAVAVQVVAGTI
jgi:hypothetical protein